MSSTGGTKVLTRRNYQIIQANRASLGEFDPFGDFDLIFGAVKADLKVVEVPVRYRKRIGKSKITGTIAGTLRAGFKILGWIFAWRLRLLFSSRPSA